MASVLPSRSTMWRVVAGVQAGATVKASAASIGYTRGAVHRWRRRVPEFAVALDQAKLVGSRSARLKREFLARVSAGQRHAEAVSALGIPVSCPAMWAAYDATFAAAYRDARGGCRSVETRVKLDVLLGRLYAGDSLDTACRVSGIHPNTWRRWRRRGATQWAAVERALAAGAHLREGRAA